MLGIGPMASVHVELPHHTYAIQIEAGLLDLAGQRVWDVVPHGRCALVSDRTVSALYAQPLTDSLEQVGFEFREWT